MYVFHILYAEGGRECVKKIKARTIGIAKRQLKKENPKAVEMQRVSATWVRENKPWLQ